MSFISVLAGTVALGAAAPQAPYDVVLRGGMVVDGTGTPPFRADVALNGDLIAVVRRLDGIEPRVFSMSSSGFFSRRTRSAIFPASTEPCSRGCFRVRLKAPWISGGLERRAARGLHPPMLEAKGARNA